MSAVLAPNFTAFDVTELAPNHPSVRAKHDRDLRRARLHVVENVGVSQGRTAVSGRLSWDAIALRVALFVLAALVMVFLGMLVGLGLSPDLAAIPVDYVAHLVVPGDTLWGIAASNAAGVPADTVLSNILQANSLTEDAVLNVGQTVLVPVF